MAIAGFVRFYRKKQRREPALADAIGKELLQEFIKAAKSNNAAAAVRTLLAWLDHSKIVGTSPSLQHFCDLVSDPELKQEIVSLETSLYAAKLESQWSGDKLLNAVQRARKYLYKWSLHDHPADLPELNPGR